MSTGDRTPGPEARLRTLPAMHELLAHPALRAWSEGEPPALVKRALDLELEELRRRIRAGEPADPSPDGIAARARERFLALRRPVLRPVLNATGVVLHTNLGRAPLSEAALAAVERVARGYSNLEYDLEAGRRGSRHNLVSGLLRELTGAEDGFAVNNNAAAVLLALSALARGREVVVSRGELIEIGGSFRIPDVLEQSGARLVEVGTTNRTRLEDFLRATGPETAAYLKVHPSNYRIVGFTASVDLAALVQAAHRRGLLALVDLGSGSLVDLGRIGLGGEPTVQEAVAAGADLVTFSGDKLLGGPQAGLLVGRREVVERCRRHPLARAVRIDKLTVAALEATLAAYRQPERAWEEIPALRMLALDERSLQVRALRLAEALAARLGRAAVEAVPGESRAGGGSLPEQALPTWLVAVRAAEPERVAARLRAADPPVVARLREGRLLLDLRTVRPEEEEQLATALLGILAP
ncbi:MAG: L-seryl-tRNA(Sec) selenium transferase [Firmicutes bacterium]|nr:L-seryl-tRNA(Sec) selenium transferase [Bacillota bacterium]